MRSRKAFIILLLSLLPGFPGCGGTGSFSKESGPTAAVPAGAGLRDTGGATDFLPPDEDRGPQVLPAAKCRDAWHVGNKKHRFDPDSPAEPYADYLARLDRENCHKDWTVLVYMAADNDLTPYALWDLYEMEAGYRSGVNRAGSTLKTDLLVQLDTASPAEGVRRLHLFQRREAFDPALGIEHFRAATADSVRSPVVSRLAESPDEPHELRLRRFLEWGIRAYPSKHYMVVIWGHGQGWRGETPGKGFGGIGFDDSDGGYLNIPSVRRSLEFASEEVLGGKPIDVYAADSCLMQMLEVAHEVAPRTRFIVGSTQVQNYLGLPYRRILHELNSGNFAGFRAKYPSADEGYLVAKMLPKLFRASFSAGGLQSRHAPEAVREVTMSAISSAELEHLFVPALERFAASLSDYLIENPLRAIHVQHIAESAPKFMGGAQDLGIFLGLLKRRLREEEPTPAAIALMRALDALRDALDRTVLAYAFGTRFEDPSDPFFLPGWFRAVSLWLPVRASEYRARVHDFRSSELFRRLPQWEEWMEKIYSEP